MSCKNIINPFCLKYLCFIYKNHACIFFIYHFIFIIYLSTARKASLKGNSKTIFAFWTKRKPADFLSYARFIYTEKYIKLSRMSRPLNLYIGPVIYYIPFMSIYSQFHGDVMGFWTPSSRQLLISRWPRPLYRPNMESVKKRDMT